MSLIIVVFCRFADNYSSSVQTATEYKLVAKDLKEAHETLSIPLKFICSSERYEKNNEVETNVPLLGLLWNRNDDSISFNGTFSLSKKNRMGQTKSLDISQIDKKCFRDMNWLKQNVTKRVILRLTMTHFDPIGAH